jgi:hypothetical protein
VNPRYASFPLLSALKERRSRRFCRGMEMKDGPLRFKSRFPPMALSAEEEALMVFAACGITGCALGDVSYATCADGGNIMAGLIGRTISSGDGIQTVSLVTISDTGVYLYRRPQELTNIPEIIELNQSNRFIEAAQRMRVRICEKRVRVSSDPIFNINANRWSLHAPGTTLFVPINELTFMYINGLLEILNESTGVFIVDERAGFRPAGLARFAKSRGGHLHDNPAAERFATVAVVERLVTEFVTIEQGMMLQNLGLMAHALGLGGFPNFANHEFAWLEALNFQTEQIPASKYLAVGGARSLAMKLLRRDALIPVPIGLQRNGETLLKSYSPPHFPNMRAAVQAVVASKFGKRGVFRGGAGPRPWKDAAVASAVPEITDRAIEATTSYCEYIWSRYGRFPATMPPFRTVLAFQAGHPDHEFYEKFYLSCRDQRNAPSVRSTP